MARWRVVVHALDRTGPPVLARTFLRWLAAERPDDDVDVVAVRGGALLGDMVHLADVHVVLDPGRPGTRTTWTRSGSGNSPTDCATLEPPDATLLVSVAGGQVLPLLADMGPVVTWVVEQGEDLHWLDTPLGLRERTTRWLAGSESSRAELHHRLPDTPVDLDPGVRGGSRPGRPRPGPSVPPVARRRRRRPPGGRRGHRHPAQGSGPVPGGGPGTAAGRRQAGPVRVVRGRAGRTAPSRSERRPSGWDWGTSRSWRACPT